MSAPKRHTWTLAERHLIHIAHHEYNVPWDSIEEIFHHLFASNWSGLTMPNRTHLQNDYGQRDNESRTGTYGRDIIKNEDDYSDGEKQARQKARDDIWSAAAFLSIAVPNGATQMVSAAAGASLGSAGSSTAPAQPDASTTDAGEKDEKESTGAEEKDEDGDGPTEEDEKVSEGSPSDLPSPHKTRSAAARKTDKSS